MSVPLVPGITVFGIAVGAAAAQKGLTLVELVAMNALVYAGASQLVALGLWRESWSWAALVSVALATLTVNSRLLLMSAALRPIFGPVSPLHAYPALMLLTDANYVMSLRAESEPVRSLGIFLGAGLFIWIIWVLTPIPGYLAGRLVVDPRAFGLDLVMPVVFAGMVARLWKGREDTIAWIVAGLVGYLIHRVLGGALHVVAGALAGMAVAALLARSGRSPSP